MINSVSQLIFIILKYKKQYDEERELTWVDTESKYLCYI